MRLDKLLGTGGNRYERLKAGLAAKGMPSGAPGVAALAGDTITVAIQGFTESRHRRSGRCDLRQRNPPRP